MRENKHTKQLREEYPTIYEGYTQIVSEQLELFSKKTHRLWYV